MSNGKIAEVGVNIQEKATVIWNIANAPCLATSNPMNMAL